MKQATTEMPWYPRAKRLRHLALLGTLCVLNIVLAITVAPEIVNLGGVDYPTGQGQVISGAILTVLITYNFLGFLIGTFLALIPSSKYPYGQRYVRASFMTMIVLQFAVAVYAVLLWSGSMHPIVF